MSKFAKLLLVVVMPLLCLHQLRAETILFERSGAGVLQRALLINRGQLDRAYARFIARKYLKDYGAHYSVITVVVGEYDRDVRASVYQLAPRGQIGSTYQAALEQYVAKVRDMGPLKGPVARLISINGNALLAYRNGATLNEEVLRGADPTRLRVGSKNYQLLHLSLGTGTLALPEDLRYDLNLYYLSASTISMSTTYAVIQRLRREFSIKNLTVAVRSIPWFYELDGYPSYPAFLKDLPTPSIADYQFSAFLGCSVGFGHRLTCNGSNFEP